jgi:hypothetical protein
VGDAAQSIGAQAIELDQHHDERSGPVADPDDPSARIRVLALVDDAHLRVLPVEVDAGVDIGHRQCDVRQTAVGHVLPPRLQLRASVRPER